ncbi:hypothetical protein [Pseudochryseolinea flava]|uniref:Lipocalin-like domain-containing protein n=1 Tax=Pseudochryseolinea flava TaxID=2059302 RepID=A0A364Y3N6_9BACT|nr:hypothetical protein [Pseudochryseolinea flava]RAW01396.1 hypothetical protein DQQ10_10870 [Pseudochryseolinea flava]
MKAVKVMFWFMMAIMLPLATIHAQDQKGKKVTKKLISDVVGKWELKETVDLQKKGAIRKDTLGFDWIEFSEDGKYSLGSAGQNGTVEAIDSGSYRVNEQGGLLYLDSSSDNGQVSQVPSEWTIAVKEAEMKISSRASVHGKRFEYRYHRVKEGLNKK